jgi:XTP/dITP diphosphohydrolase
VKQRNLLIATLNLGKLQELRQLFEKLPFVISDLRGSPCIQPVPETGETFIENASLKAAGYATQTGLLTLADDSGLEVEYLNGAPGVFSARYAHEGASDAERTKTLLTELTGAAESARSARFVSVIAIADEFGAVISVSTGTCQGRIANAPRGTNGFGYDPVFIPNGFDRTFAELEIEVKNRISHRAQALAGAVEFLGSLTTHYDAG